MWVVIEITGTLVAALLVAASLCVALALGVGSRAHRGRAAPLKRLSSFVLEFFYLPLKVAFGKLGRKASLDGIMVSLKNRVNRRRFERSRRRLLLAPQCLRSVDCPAPSTRRGILCRRCGRCKMAAILAECDRLGYRLFLLTGSSFIPTILAEERPDAALLVACPYECNKVMMALGALATYAVCLDRDGCVNTDVSLDRVREAMRLGLPNAEEPHPEPAAAQAT